MNLTSYNDRSYQLHPRLLTFPRESPCICPRVPGVMPIPPPEYWPFLVNHPVYVPDYMASCLSPPPDYWPFLVNHLVYVRDYIASCLSPTSRILTFPRESPCICPRLHGVMITIVTTSELWSPLLFQNVWKRVKWKKEYRQKKSQRDN